MPHSSGGSSSYGGVHSGGSFGGGSHHSGSHGGSSTPSYTMSHICRSSSKYRYALYTNNKIKYYYSDDEPEAPSFKNIGYALTIIGFMLVMMFFTAFLPNLNIPVNLSSRYNDDRLFIEDNLKLLSDEDKAGIVEVCKDFYNTTGIVVGVATVDYNDAKYLYNSLERYAYAKYCSTYDDECHWLLVFGYDSTNNQWYFEGMQGDDTDHIITEEKANAFNTLLDKHMLSNGFENVGSNLIKTFKECDIDWMSVTLNSPEATISLSLLVPVIMMVYLLLPAIVDYILTKHRYNLYKHCVRCPSVSTVQEDVCEYCDGLYVVGTVLNCPHCGAHIPPHNKRGVEDA